MRAIFGDDFVAAFARDGDSADVAEAPQAVIVVRAPGQLHDLERAAEIDVQAAFFGFAVQRGGAVDHGVRGMNQAIVIVAVQAETGAT